MGDGLGVSVDGGRGRDCSRRGLGDAVRPMFPVREVDGAAAAAEVDWSDELCAPCEEEEQAAMPMCLPSVYQPTRSEYLDHCVTNYPFRAWCKHCLEGRGREFGHDKSRGDKDERATPVISFDYCFISDVGEITTEDAYAAAGVGAAKILVARDSRSKSVFAHVVPQKGVDCKGFAVSSLVEDVLWLGYTRITLKSAAPDSTSAISCCSAARPPMERPLLPSSA